MTPQRIGGLLLVAGSAGFGLKVLSSLEGSTTAVGAALLPVPGAIYIGSMLLLGLGAAIVAIDWPSLRAARPARAGLLLTTVGFLGLAYLEANPMPRGDPLGYPIVVWPIYVCYPLGQIVLGLALLREPGLGRAVGALLFGVLPVIVLLQGAQGPAAAPGAATDVGVVGVIRLAAAVGTIVGWAGLGFLVYRRGPDGP